MNNSRFFLGFIFSLVVLGIFEMKPMTPFQNQINNNNNNNNNNLSVDDSTARKRDRDDADQELLEEVAERNTKKVRGQDRSNNNFSENKYFRDTDFSSIFMRHFSNVLPWASERACFFASNDKQKEEIELFLASTYVKLLSFPIHDRSPSLIKYFVMMCDEFFKEKNRAAFSELFSDFRMIFKINTTGFSKETVKNDSDFYDELIKICGNKLHHFFPELSPVQHTQFLQSICDALVLQKKDTVDGIGEENQSIDNINPRFVFLLNSYAKLRSKRIESFVVDVLLQIYFVQEVRPFWDKIRLTCLDILDPEKLQEIGNLIITKGAGHDILGGFINNLSEHCRKFQQEKRMSIDFILN